MNLSNWYGILHLTLCFHEETYDTDYSSIFLIERIISFYASHLKINLRRHHDLELKRNVNQT